MITVVIPAYNAEETIEKAVRSVLNQSVPADQMKKPEETKETLSGKCLHTPLEVIVVDDGSTDGTEKILTRLKEEDARVKVIRQENAGVSAARNTGIRAASGRYLMTLDDDDTMEPGMLQSLREAMEQEDSDLAICGIRLIYPDHTEIFDTDKNPFRRVSEGEISEQGVAEQGMSEQGTSEQVISEKNVLLNTERSNTNAEPEIGKAAPLREFLEQQMLQLYDHHLLTTHSNKLYRLDLIRENNIYYNPALQINEDTDFVLRYLTHCGKVSLIPGAYLNYYQHGVGQSLITTFRKNGVSSALGLKRDLDGLYQRLENEQSNITGEIAKNINIADQRTESESIESRSIGSKSIESKNTENKNTENKNTENKNTENKNTENKNTENKNTENKNTSELTKLKAGMDHRLLVHILSCVGLMYSRSSMSEQEIKKELEALNEDDNFRQLLCRTKPQDLKTAVAKFLLEHRLTGLYHRICRVMYL